MARPNHSFEKRRREIAKQQKKEEKRQRRLEKCTEDAGVDGVDAEVEAGDDAAVAGDVTDDIDTSD